MDPRYPDYVALAPWGQVVPLQLKDDAPPIETMFHSPDMCEGRGCPIHHPSDHHMAEWPMTLRLDNGTLIERQCPHGTGHPDPDSVRYLEEATGQTHWGVHGCDGCCRGEEHGP